MPLSRCIWSRDTSVIIVAAAKEARRRERCGEQAGASGRGRGEQSRRRRHDFQPDTMALGIKALDWSRKKKLTAAEIDQRISGLKALHSYESLYLSFNGLARYCHHA